MDNFKIWLETLQSQFSDSDFEGDGYIEKNIGGAKIIWYKRVGGDLIELSSIRVPRNSRKQGIARNAMIAFLAEIDKRQLKVKLLASPLDKRTHLGKLVAFYQSLGFKVTGIGNPAGDPIMIREPQPLKTEG